MRHPRKTPPFRGPRGEPVPGSIAEAHNLQIGGMDQWALIRGERATNPPLVLLHGGPGMSETSFFRRCNAPLEKSFAVVYWDQPRRWQVVRPQNPERFDDRRAVR